MDFNFRWENNWGTITIPLECDESVERLRNYCVRRVGNQESAADYADFLVGMA